MATKLTPLRRNAAVLAYAGMIARGRSTGYDFIRTPMNGRPAGLDKALDWLVSSDLALFPARSNVLHLTPKGKAALATTHPEHITIQPSQMPDGKLPYPFHVEPEGYVGRQDFWRGDPFKIVGFARRLDVASIDVGMVEFRADPQSVINMYVVSEDVTGQWGTHPAAVQSISDQRTPIGATRG